MSKRLLCLHILLFSVAALSFAQSPDAVLPPINITLSSEKSIWAAGDAGTIKVTLENPGNKKAGIRPGLSLLFSELTNTKNVTMRERVFSSPLSLLKRYEYPKTGCSDDLLAGRKTGFVIKPETGKLELAAGEKREFTFDALKLCWGHLISSMYPYRSLFDELNDGYKASGQYNLTASMSFRTGTYRMSGVEVPISKSITSNVVAIRID